MLQPHRHRRGMKIAVTLLAVFVGIVTGSPAPAESAPKLLDRFDGWSAYTLPGEKGVLCYALAHPSSSYDKSKANKPLLMVTHRSAEKTYDVVSIQVGEDLAKDGNATVTLGKKKFEFFTRQQTAWSRDSETDKTVVTTMIGAKKLIVAVPNTKGAPLTQTYSLDGFGKALNDIDKACAVKR